MNSIHKTRAVERQAWEEIKGLLSDLSSGQLQPRFRDTDPGVAEAQADGFDVTSHCWRYSNGAPAKLECKAEEKHTGNLFIETWSNRSFGKQKPGWAITIKADWLIYYFLDEKVLYIIKTKPLWEWLFGTEDNPTAAFVMFREKLQQKNKQLNKTWGRIVPLGHIYRNVKFYKFRNRNGWELEADVYCDDLQQYQNLPRDWNHDLNYQTENPFTRPKVG